MISIGTTYQPHASRPGILSLPPFGHFLMAFEVPFLLALLGLLIGVGFQGPHRSVSGGKAR
jgi:hypothetical protein